MTLMISIGRWGGVYWYRGYTLRLCLGWVAFTYVPIDDTDWQIVPRYPVEDADDHP